MQSGGVLLSGETADYGALGCGCSGLVAVARGRVSVANQFDSEAGDADGASGGLGEITWVSFSR